MMLVFLNGWSTTAYFNYYYTMKYFITILLIFIVSLSAAQRIAVSHSGYTTEWDDSLKYPVQVSWWCTKQRLLCDAKLIRTGRFSADPELKKQTSIAADYTNSGYDKGHMCPVTDNQCDSLLLAESFYFSNSAPQLHALNVGSWQKLETRTRELALHADSVRVWCGALGSHGKMGKTTIPAKYWKVIYINSSKKWEAYLFSNVTIAQKPLEKLKVSVNRISKLTGLTFKP